jgi:dTDP-4-amino-4,6-dideoxygalactose transaminase
VAAFSFFPSKNLGAFGDGGAVLTNDEALSHRIRLIANHGQPRKNEHLIVGRNSRLDGIQAAVLAAKLPFLDAWNDARRRAAETLRAKLAHLEPDLQLPMIEPDRDHVFHIFAVEHERRDELAEALRVEGIGTGVHYPVPMPLTPAYASLGGTAAEFPNAVRHSNRLLSLPLFAEITPAQLDRIAARVSTFVKGG